MSHLTYKLIFFCYLAFGSSSCVSSSQSDEAQGTEIEFIQFGQDEQIAEYIRQIFQDKNGDFWFGTNGYGTAHFNGDSVIYYSIGEGFNGHQITGITEDLSQNIWFSTDQGVVKYDWSKSDNGETQFTNYTDFIYFQGQRFWSIFADSQGNVWAGAEREIFKFDGNYWTAFKLPYPKVISGEFITEATTWCITEDHKGHLWFSTNGFGAFKYDGESFSQFSEKDGLTDNSIDVIIEDYKQNIWFGTRNGGLSKYDGQSFMNFTEKDSIDNNEVCAVYADNSGNIWLSSEGYGVYCFDGNSFKNYALSEGLGVKAVQAIMQDREGRIWVGGGGGLYRLVDDRFINVTKSGPWE